MASFMFGVNPFSTPVGQRIDRATDGSLASEDWALNIEICDIINETDEGPKDATRALRKRLQGNKNWKAVLLTLTVLETCVKNCGRRFHVCIASKEFMTEMTKLLSPKNNPPQIVQEKILSLIQSWSDAFRGHPDLIVVVQTYESMKAQGIEFPAQDLDTLSPIYTPERSVPFQPKANNQLVSRPETDAAPRQSEPNSPVTQPLAPSYPPPVQGYQPPVIYPQQQPPVIYPQQQPPVVYPQQQPPTGYPTPQQTGPIQPNTEQLGKLRSQLDVVEQNAKVMSEMLTEMSPGQEETDDLQLLQELNRTCRAMQSRVMELLDKVANEEVMSECLRINDDLNNVFIRYDRFERYRQAAQQQTTPSAVAALQDTRWADPANQVPIERGEEGLTLESHPENSELIEFFDSQIPGQEAKPNNYDLAQQLADVELQDVTLLPGNTVAVQGQPNNQDFLLESVAQNDDFDMFAQSRKTTFEDSRRNGSTYGDNLEALTESSLASAMYGRNPNPPPAMPVSTPASTTTQEAAPGDDFQHVEQWLTTSDLSKPEAKENAANTNPQESMSSSEFEKFLSERAAASGDKPTNTTRPSTQRPPQRQMQMSEGEEDLFGL